MKKQLKPKYMPGINEGKLIKFLVINVRKLTVAGIQPGFKSPTS